MEIKNAIREKMVSTHERFTFAQQQINTATNEIVKLEEKYKADVEKQQNIISSLANEMNVIRGEYKVLVDFGVQLGICDTQGTPIEEKSEQAEKVVDAEVCEE